MFARVVALALFALPLLASAGEVHHAASNGNSSQCNTTTEAHHSTGHTGHSGPRQCNTGPVHCCNTLKASNDPKVTQLVGLLGIDAGPINALTGFNCSPISAVAVGGNSCSTQPVCCTGDHFNGAINVGCTPINVGV